MVIGHKNNKIYLHKLYFLLFIVTNDMEEKLRRLQRDELLNKVE